MKIMERGIFLRSDYFLIASNAKMKISTPELSGTAEDIGAEIGIISDIDDLNPTASSAFASGVGALFVYEDYTVSMTLTIPISEYRSARDERTFYVTNLLKNINTIGVSQDVYRSDSTFYYKPAQIVHIDFTENPYIDGIQVNIQLSLSGAWTWYDEDTGEEHQVDFI